MFGDSVKTKSKTTYVRWECEDEKQNGMVFYVRRQVEDEEQK